jgi:hypothetical protein
MKKSFELHFAEKLYRLKALLFQFDEIHHQEKMTLLNELILITPAKANNFLQFHQLLLAMMAYPTDKTLLKETEKIASELSQRIAIHKTLQSNLTGTGLAETLVECNFSYSKVNYLVGQFPGVICIHSASSSLEIQIAVLKLILPNVEYSKIHLGDKDLKTHIAEFHRSKKQTDLEWLLQTISHAVPDIKMQAFLYNQLGIFIQWKISDKTNSVSFLRGASLPVYFHTKPLDKKVDLQNIIQQKLPKPVKLTLNEKRQLIHAAKLTLTYLYRETEPFTNANENDITLFYLGKGISIALFGSISNKRYSLESYIGYLVLKNNIPASYGGGWIFGERCQFGINILESFRGGESGLIICELLRTYYQYFGATRFVVKPYQFGLHNMEAIKTGAFWFYYKLGFRPENENLKQLALKEELAKQKDPHYKSDVAALKKYTKSNLALTVSGNSYPDYDCEELSKAITHFINDQFDGNRKNALDHCFKILKENLNIRTKEWKQEDLEYARQISVLFCIGPDSKTRLRKHKKEILLFIQLKSAETEMPWIKHLQQFDAFWEMLQYII